MVFATLRRQTAFTGGPRGTLWVSMPIFVRYSSLCGEKTKFSCQENRIFPYKIGTFWKIIKIDDFEPPKKVLKHILEGKWSPDVIRERSKLSNDIGHELIRERSCLRFFFQIALRLYRIKGTNMVASRCFSEIFSFFALKLVV